MCAAFCVKTFSVQACSGLGYGIMGGLFGAWCGHVALDGPNKDDDSGMRTGRVVAGLGVAGAAGGVAGLACFGVSICAYEFLHWRRMKEIEKEKMKKEIVRQERIREEERGRESLIRIMEQEKAQLTREYEEEKAKERERQRDALNQTVFN